MSHESRRSRSPCSRSPRALSMCCINIGVAKLISYCSQPGLIFGTLNLQMASTVPSDPRIIDLSIPRAEHTVAPLQRTAGAHSSTQRSQGRQFCPLHGYHHSITLVPPHYQLKNGHSEIRQTSCIGSSMISWFSDELDPTSLGHPTD
jgi:hypothetical protein